MTTPHDDALARRCAEQAVETVLEVAQRECGDVVLAEEIPERYLEEKAKTVAEVAKALAPILAAAPVGWCDVCSKPVSKSVCWECIENFDDSKLKPTAPAVDAARLRSALERAVADLEHVSGLMSVDDRAIRCISKRLEAALRAPDPPAKFTAAVNKDAALEPCSGEGDAPQSNSPEIPDSSSAARAVYQCSVCKTVTTRNSGICTVCANPPTIKESLTVAGDAAGGERETEFTCPKCGGHEWGTNGATGKMNEWVGICNNCTFRWERKTDDEKYGLGPWNPVVAVLHDNLLLARQRADAAESEVLRLKQKLNAQLQAMETQTGEVARLNAPRPFVDSWKAKLESAEQTVAALCEGLEACQPIIDGLAKEEHGYGFYCCDDPRQFRPDPECSTPDERKRHRRHCKLLNDGLPIPADDKGGYGLGGYLMVDPQIANAKRLLEAALAAARATAAKPNQETEKVDG